MPQDLTITKKTKTFAPHKYPQLNNFKTSTRIVQQALTSRITRRVASLAQTQPSQHNCVNTARSAECRASGRNCYIHVDICGM